MLRPLGLTFARYEVLMLLCFSRKGSLPVGKIGERLQVHPASVTNAVHRLEDDGFVIRVANPADGRSVLAEITAAGRESAGQATAAAQREVFSIVPISALAQRGRVRRLEAHAPGLRGFPLSTRNALTSK